MSNVSVDFNEKSDTYDFKVECEDGGTLTIAVPIGAFATPADFIGSLLSALLGGAAINVSKEEDGQ